MQRIAYLFAVVVIIAGVTTGVASAIVAEPTPAEQCQAKGKCQTNTNGGMVQGHYEYKDNSCSCKADSTTDSGQKSSTPVNETTDDIKKQAQTEAAQQNSSQDSRGGSMNGGQGTNPTGTAGVQGQNGSPSGNAIADPKSNTGWGEMTSGTKGDQLFQQLGREAAARGEPGIGYTNTSNNGSISNGQVVFYGDKNDIAAINDLAQNGDAYTADYFKPVDCWACNDPRFQGGQASIDFMRDNIANGYVDPERFRLTPDGFEFLLTAAEVPQYLNAVYELNTFGPSGSAAQAYGTWSGDFSYRPPVSPFGMNSASFSNGLGGVMTNGLGSANCSSGVCVVSGQGGVVQPIGSGIAAPQPPSNLTAEQKAEWLRAFNQASASCGSDMLCRMAAQQTASQAVQNSTTNTNTIASYFDPATSPVTAAFDAVKGAASAAWGGITDGFSSAFGGNSLGDAPLSGSSGTDSLQGGLDSGVPANSYFARSSTYGWGQGSGDSPTQGLKYAPGTLADNPYTIASNDPSEAGQRYAVTNPATGQTVIAQVNDSGPFEKDENGNFVPHSSRQYDVGKQVALDIGMGYGVKDLVYTPVAADTPLGPSIEPYYNASSDSLKAYADFSSTDAFAGLNPSLPVAESTNGNTAVGPPTETYAHVSSGDGSVSTNLNPTPFSFEVVREANVDAETVRASEFSGQTFRDVTPGELARQGGFTGTSLTALTDLPGTSASPFNLAGDTVASVTTMPTYAAVPPVETLTAVPPTSLATLSESAPAFDTASPVGVPSDSVIAQDDVEFNEQYFNMSGRRTDSDPGGDTSALDVANPRQTALGPQPVGGVGQAVPDAMPQYANREEQAAYTRRSSDSGYQADAPTASRWGFYAPNPLGAPGPDSFYYPSPTPQLGGGPLAQSESWTHMPADVPSPFISQTEGNAFPRTVSLTTPGAQYEASLNAPETNFPQTGSLQPDLATPDTVLGSPANTEYAPTGSPDPATIPVVDQTAAEKELADFKAQQDAAKAPLASAEEPKSFTDKLSQYFSDVKEKIAETASGFGINIVGQPSPIEDTSGVANQTAGEIPPVKSVSGIEVSPPEPGQVEGKGDSLGLVEQGPFAYLGKPSPGTGDAPAGDVTKGLSYDPKNPYANTQYANSQPTPSGTQSGTAQYPDAAARQGTLNKDNPTTAGVQGPTGSPSGPAAKVSDSPGAGTTPPTGPGGGLSGPGGGGGSGGGSNGGGGSGAGGAFGLLNSALGLAKSMMGQGQGQGGASTPTPTQPVQVNPQNPLATPVPSTQFAQQKPPTPAPKVSVVANPNPVQPNTASTISWQATWADAQPTSTTRECAVVDVTGKPLVESAGVASSVQSPALTRAAYFFVGCKQSDGKMGSEKVLVTVQGDSQPPIAPPANLSAALSTGTTGDPAADLSAALSGSSGSGSTVPAANNSDQQQPVNVACDPNSSRYFDCLTQKMQFVDKLY